MMLNSIFPYRFQLYFYSQLSIVFGSLIFPVKFFDTVMMPILLLSNILCGVLLVSEQQIKLRLYLGVFLVLMILYILSLLQIELQSYHYLKLVLYSIFYISITNDIIKQVWYAKRVTKNTIFGLMSGYMALGLVFFFIFTAIEIFYNGSFSQIKFADGNVSSTMNTLLYFSYVTMMTLGYGDIVPLTEVAQKAAILCGLVGQFYLVIVTAIIVGKYIKHITED